MKKINAILLLTAMMLLITTGCGRKAVLSETEALETVNAAWENYRQMYYNIWGQGLGVTADLTGENLLIKSTVTGNMVYPVEGDIQTIEQLKAAVEEVCTAEFAQKSFYQPYLEDSPHPLYEEIDGKLYVGVWTNPYRVQPISECLITSLAADKIQAEITGITDSVTGVTETYNVTFALDNGKWLVSDIDQNQPQ